MPPLLLEALMQLAIRLAPIAEDAVVAGFKLLVEQIPGDAHQQFLWGAADIVRGVFVDHPDWDEAQKRRYSIDAINQLALDMEVTLDPHAFDSLENAA